MKELVNAWEEGGHTHNNKGERTPHKVRTTKEETAKGQEETKKKKQRKSAQAERDSWREHELEINKGTKGNGNRKAMEEEERARLEE